MKKCLLQGTHKFVRTLNTREVLALTKTHCWILSLTQTLMVSRAYMNSVITSYTLQYDIEISHVSANQTILNVPKFSNLSNLQFPGVCRIPKKEKPNDLSQLQAVAGTQFNSHTGRTKPVDRGVNFPLFYICFLHPATEYSSNNLKFC